MKNEDKIILLNPTSGNSNPVILNTNMQPITSAKQEEVNVTQVNPTFTPLPDEIIDEKDPLDQGDKSDKTLGYVMPHEAEEAKKFIEKELGFALPRPCGYHMLVKIFIRTEKGLYVDKDGKESIIALPESLIGVDKYTSCVALVVAQGPQCYKGPKFQESNFRKLCRLFFNRWMEPCYLMPRCQVGDWIVIPRNEGTQFSYRGVTMQTIIDEYCMMVIPDPTFVTRT